MLAAQTKDQPCSVGTLYTASAIKHSPGLDFFPTIRNSSKPLSHFHQRRPRVTHCPGEHREDGREGREELQEVGARAGQAVPPEHAPRQGRTKHRDEEMLPSSPALTPSGR